MDTLYEKLAEKFAVRRDEPMKHHTSFNVGGPADCFAMPPSVEALAGILSLARLEGIDVTVIGGGTNILVTDGGIRGLVISLAGLKGEISTVTDDAEKIYVTVPAGKRLASVCRLAAENGYHGIEFAAGIPGTVGGALVMNAGTPEKTISEITHTIETITQNGERKIFHKSAFRPAYRKLGGIEGIISGCTFLLEKGDRKAVEKRHRETLEKKKRQQPISARSAGCFFRNPEKGMPAGMLIEKAGMKGKQHKAAMVSDIHANYILNTGDATCADILELAEMVRQKVVDTFSIKLETEVVIKGE